MKTNIKTYADIEEISENYTKRYSVVFTEQYDLIICGINFGKKERKIKFPFYFKSFDIAKDFCELKPTKYQEICFYNNDDSRQVKYYTYKIQINDKEFYIRWENNSTKIENDHNMYFLPTEKPIIESFVTNIELKDWFHTHNIGNIKFYNETYKLSDIVNFKKVESESRHWHFELVENNDKN